MEKLTTATGKKFDCDFFTNNSTRGTAHIRITGADLMTVAKVFSDPKETVQLWWEGMYLSQYTKLMAIIPEGNVIRVNLGKE